MFKSKLLWTGALAGLGLVTAAAYAEPTAQELQQKINDLQAQVTQLQSNQATQQHQLDARDVDATVNSVLSDADSHSMLVDGGGVTAGWDKAKMGFFIASEDGSSMLHPGFIWQFRQVDNWRQQEKSTTDSAVGFENSVLEPYVCGSLFTKDLTFKILYDSAVGGSPNLTDMYVKYVFAHGVCGGDLAVKGGQFVDPVFKEQFIGDANSAVQLVAARSLLNDLIGGGLIGPRVQGVEVLLTGNDNPLHVTAAFDDGGQSANTDFQQVKTLNFANISGTVSSNWGAAVRVDYKVMGDWKDADAFSAKGNKQDLLVVGLGGNVTELDNAYAFLYTGDVQYNTMNGKLSLYAAFVGNYADLRNVSINGDGKLANYGFLVQAGYMVTDNIEVFGRWDWTRLDADFTGVVGDVANYNEVTLGANYYLGDNGSWGNHAKLTLDVTYLPQGSPINFATGDVLQQTNDNGNELMLRAQFTLWI